MKIDKLIRKLKNIKQSLKDKDIYIISKNGLLMDPEIRLKLENIYEPLELTKENVNCLILTT